MKITSAKGALYKYGERDTFLAHKPEIVPPSPEDPLFTAIAAPELDEEGHDSQACNEPPPGGYDDGDGNDEDGFASLNSFSEEAVFQKAALFDDGPDVGSIIFLRTCKDTVPESNTIPAKYLSVSLFPGSFEDHKNYYEGLMDGEFPPPGVFTDDPNPGDNIDEFTVFSQLGHYVKIVRTNYPDGDYVLRFSYREENRFVESVEIINE
ncbi:MAG: hypothetical protein AAFR61_18750 [Bacteroidota bacterium]